MEAGVTGLSDREDDGDGELDTLERVEETEGGRVDMILGEEMLLFGVEGLERCTGASGRVSDNWDWDGMVLSRGMDLSDRDRGWRIADQNWPVDVDVIDSVVESFSTDHVGEALRIVRVLVVETVRDNEDMVGLW